MPSARLGSLTATLLWLAAAHAQTGSGSIQGTVKDSAGAVIPSAKISITHIDTGRQQQTSTNEVGFYIVPSIQTGRYKICAQAPGMQTWEGDMLLQTGQAAVVDSVMKPGATVTESV